MQSSPVPQYQPPADDPQYLALKAQADQDRIAALQNRAGLDSAALMTRYGARLTTAAAGSSPATAAPPVTPLAAGTGGPVGTPDVVNALFPGRQVA